MAVKSAEPRRSPAPDRRPAPAAIASPSVAAVSQASPIRASQQRLGNQGMQVAIRARLTADPPTAAPSSGESVRPPATAAASPTRQAAPQVAGATASPASATATPEAVAPAAAAPTAAAPGSTAAREPAPAGAGGQAAAASAQAATAVPVPVPVDGQTEPPTAAAQSQALLAPVTAQIARRAAAQSHHPKPDATVGSAEAAAVHPETAARGEAAHAAVTAVAEVKPGQLEAERFKQALRQRVQQAMKSGTEADSESALKTETAEAVGSSVRDELGQQRQTASGPMAEAAASPPQPGQFPQPAAPGLQAPEIGAAPAPVAAPMPPAVAPEQLDTSADRNEVDAKLAEGHLAPAQLAKSSDPTVSRIAEARDAAVQHSEAGAADVRAADAQSRAAVHAGAGAAIGGGLAGMSLTRGGSIGRVSAQQFATKLRNEQKRQQITAKLNGIQQKTSAGVEAILNEMEKTAASLFDAGLKRAIEAFEAERRKLEEKARTARAAEHSTAIGRFFAYYSDLGEEEVEKAIAGARNAFDHVVETTIDVVATFVGLKLAEAKARAMQGRAEADAEVAKLPADLQGIGREARAQVEGAFEKLDAEIDSRRDALVEKLSQSYAAARTDMDARAQAFRDDNKSWWDRVKEAVVGFVKAILKFREMLLSILAKAMGVVDAILDDPIGFLGNLVAGVRLGFDNFTNNIAAHLKAGLMSWLFGTLASAGIEMPSSFGVKEIIGLILQILGLTYANIRARAVRLLGEPFVANLEKTAEMFKVLIAEGPAGLWHMLVEKLDALKEQVLGQVREMVISEVIEAGVVWLIGLLNPASAFIKACKAIYDIVMFFIERGRQIVELINAILDSLAAIASGNLAKMASGVENALAKTIPVVIGFLASLLGLGGISEKVKAIIEKIQEPVNKAIDWLIGKAVSLVKAAGQAIGGMFKKKDDKATETPDPAHDAKVEAGLTDIDKEEQNHLEADGKISHQGAEKTAAQVKKNHPIFKSITVVSREGRWDYDYVASAGKKKGLIQEEGGTGPRTGEAPYSDANAAIAIVELAKYKAASDVSDAMAALGEAGFEKYKAKYPAYLETRKDRNFQWPLPYLRMQASTSVGKAGQGEWLKKGIPGASPQSFYIGENHRIPDAVNSSTIGDVKDVEYLSFTEQLRDFYTIAKQEDPYTGTPVTVLQSDKKTRVTEKREFVLVIRKKTSKQKETELSAPLRAKLDRIVPIITHEVEEP
jgi:hypothetical protein